MQNNTKLYYCTDTAIQYRYRKIKSVISALGCNVVDVPKQTFFELKELSSIPTLPLLSTDEGNFTNSNTIIRYLATKNEYKLYGENLHERALIDQWLDLTVCDFDTCVVAVNVYLEGKEVDIDKVIEDAEKFLTHLNRHLKNRKYLVGDSLTIADLAIAATIAPVLSHMYGQNERKKFGILSNWFQSLAEHNKFIEPKSFPKKMHKAFEKRKIENQGTVTKDAQIEDKEQNKTDPKNEKLKNKDKTKTKQDKPQSQKCDEKTKTKPKTYKKQKCPTTQPTTTTPQSKTEQSKEQQKTKQIESTAEQNTKKDVQSIDAVSGQKI